MKTDSNLELWHVLGASRVHTEVNITVSVTSKTLESHDEVAQLMGHF